MDALAAHLSERNARVAADISHANAKIEKLEARLKGTIALAIIFGPISGVLFSRAAKLLW